MDKRTSLSYFSKHHGKVPLQVSITSSVILNEVPPIGYIETNEHQYRCIRCGFSMEKTKSVFVNIQPPEFQLKKNCSSISMEILSKSNASSTSLESDIETSSIGCCLRKGLHVCENSETEACSHDLDCSSQNGSSTLNSSALNSDGSKDEINDMENQLNTAPNEQLFQILTPTVDSEAELVAPPCTDCHVSVLNEMSGDEISDHDCISLMFQVAHLSPVRKTVEIQTDASAFRNDIGVAVNILEVYPSMSSKGESTDEQSLPGSSPNPQQNLPELDAEAEAAYRCHLKNLVPCSYCGRTFVPDRVMVHENACVERPKQRTHKTKR